MRKGKRKKGKQEPKGNKEWWPRRALLTRVAECHPLYRVPRDGPYFSWKQYARISVISSSLAGLLQIKWMFIQQLDGKAALLGEDGPCHEATASVSAMAMAMAQGRATATMRIARACGRLAGNDNAVTATLLHLTRGSITAPSQPRRGPFQNRHRVMPDTLLSTG